MIVRYADGSHVEGVIHSLERGTLRATLAGGDDAVEYTLVGNGWTSETGEDVTFEFAAGGPACAAGGDCILRHIQGTGPVLVN
jgi:hypothetical protein